MRCGAEFSSYKALTMRKTSRPQLGSIRFPSFVPYTIGHCPRNRSAHSHISHGRSMAVQDLPRVEHGHQAAPATRSHPPTEPTTSHQDFLVPKTRGYFRISCRPTAPRHRTRDLDGSSPSPPSLAPSLQSDPPSSTAPNMGSIVAGHVPTAKIFPDRHFDETGRTSMSPRRSERIARPTRRAGPPTRARSG